MSRKKICLRHIAEVYLYEYFCLNGDEYEISDEDTLTPHKIKAKELMLAGEYEKARQELFAVRFDNPVDIEALLSLILCCKQLGDVEDEYSYTIESYNYCCTRAELAAYYRNLGWYYLEKYMPEVAIACYKYSRYFEESQQADSELEFLGKAVGKDSIDMNLEQIHKVLLENNIPTEGNPITLALLYKAAEEAIETGNRQQALDCYRMVYDLTEDEEVGRIINSMV